MTKPISVKQKPEAEVPIEVLAESIVAMAAGIRKLRAGRLNDRALFLLIQHAAPSIGKYGQKLGVSDIKAVFAGIDALESEYLKKKPAKP